MVDTDISHAVESRLAAIEGRLDELEGAATAPEGLSSEYEGKTKAELQTDLESRGLSTSGTKSELVDRLEEDDTPDSEAEPEEVDL